MNLNKSEHKVKVSFDYNIVNFNKDFGLYSCTVQFVRIDGNSTTSIASKIPPCDLDEEKGNISVSWPSPIDKSVNNSQDQLSKITFPIQYFIAIHQKTGKNKNVIIGKTEIFTSKIEI